MSEREMECPLRNKVNVLEWLVGLQLIAQIALALLIYLGAKP